MCIWYVRTFVACMCVCFQFVTLLFSLCLSVFLSLFLFLFQHNIYEFIWYFVNGSYGHWTFFFVSSNIISFLRIQVAYDYIGPTNCWNLVMGLLFSIHCILYVRLRFVSNWNGRLRIAHHWIWISRGCASSFPTNVWNTDKRMKEANNTKIME